jgi:cell division protein FtsQ
VWHDIRLLNGLANTLLGLVLLALLASGVWWLAHRPMFTLHEIRIEVAEVTPVANAGGKRGQAGQGADEVAVAGAAGAVGAAGIERGSNELRHVNALTIRSTAVPKLRGNFFTADLDAARAAFEAVPWVRRASVRREWPNRLIVVLEEYQALATWGEDGDRLLSMQGELFTANLAEAEEDNRDHDLPQLEGPPGSEKEVLARYRAMRQWFAGIDLAPEKVVLSGRYAWSVTLDNGTHVELGREQDGATLKDRVARLIKVYPHLLTLLHDKIENVDMRYPNGVALKSRDLNAGSTAHGTAEKTGQKALQKTVQKPVGVKPGKKK